MPRPGAVNAAAKSAEMQQFRGSVSSFVARLHHVKQLAEGVANPNHDYDSSREAGVRGA